MDPFEEGEEGRDFACTKGGSRSSTTKMRLLAAKKFKTRINCFDALE